VKTLLGYIAAFVLLTVAGCGHSYPPSLRLADSLMDSRPDSALSVLDAAREHTAGAPEAVRMRYQLLRHQAMNKAFVPFTTDSAMLAVADYYDRHGTANDRLLAHYLLGCVYRDLGEAPRAIDCYLDAVAEADTASADCDFATMGRIYTQMAELYHRQLLFQNELAARQTAMQYFYQAKDTLHAIYHLGMSASACILMNKRDSAETILLHAIDLYNQHGYRQEALQASTMLMYIYAEQPERTLKLKQLIDQFESESDQFDSRHELPPPKRQFYYYKGRYFESINLLDSAEFHYRKMFRNDMTWAYRNTVYKGLLSISRKRHQADSIAKYAELYCMANDSSIAQKDQQQTAVIAASYDFVFYKNQSLENAKAAQSRLYYLICLTAVIAVLVIVVLELRHRNVNQRQEKLAEIRLLRAECAALSESLDNREMELQAQEESYQKTINAIKEAMNVKYGESLAIIAQLNIQHEEEKKRLTDEISQKEHRLSELERKIQVYSGKEVVTPYLSLGIVKRVRLLADQPGKALSDEEQTVLVEATKECYPVFIADLRHTPKIGELGIRVAILIALNIKPKTITHLLGIPYNQISNIKQDLNQGLFQENTARTLYQNICMRYRIMPY
jgi:hypothetical protein